MNENTFMIVDLATGRAIAEVSDKFATRNKLKSQFAYVRPSDYLPTFSAI